MVAVRCGRFFAFLLVLSSACSISRVATRPVPPPLTPGGQSGIASWYGPGFDGNPTSSGEIYDQNAHTAAHPTLPLGTRVRVTSFDTGRSVDVRINDRGPFVGGRVIDLSYAAAREIDMIGPGTAAVSVDPIDGVARPGAPALLPAVLYAVQAGAFLDGSRADALRASLAGARGDAYLSLLHTSDSIYYRVRLGPYPRREDALARVEELAQDGVASVVVEELGR
jgi:rare lipoprotein A